mmetsp:Transcript_41162/g.92794  ORF Transcript_41162/g.92794 Transcript_41162/m.92794 type:complete len:394 (+) Transcript_41162:1142-2323(+)
MPKNKEDHDHKNQHDDGHREDGVALHDPPDPLAPGVVPVHAAGHRVDAAHADELRPGRLQLLPHAQAAPLQRVFGSGTAPEVHKEGRPQPHADAEDYGGAVVRCPHDEVHEPEEDAADSRHCQPLIEMRHEKEIQGDALPKVVADLVNMAAPCECLEPVLVEVYKLPMLMQGEVMPELLVVHQLANVDTGAIVVLFANYVVDELDPVRGAENRSGLRVGVATVVVSLVHVVLVDVGDHAAVAVVEVPAPRVVVLVLRKGGEVLRLELELVLPHLRDLAQVLLVRGHSDEDLVPVAGVVEHQDEATVAQRVHGDGPLGLPCLHLVPLCVGWWPEAPCLLLHLRLSPTDQGIHLVGEDHDDVGPRHARPAVEGRARGSCGRTSVAGLNRLYIALL